MGVDLINDYELSLTEKIKTIEHWSGAEIRLMCIRKNYFTCGDSDAYNKMLKYVDEVPPTVSNIYMVAECIYRHSDTEELMRLYGFDKNELLGSIMFEIQDTIHKFFEVECNRPDL